MVEYIQTVKNNIGVQKKKLRERLKGGGTDAGPANYPPRIGC